VGREGLENLDRRFAMAPARHDVEAGCLAKKDILRHVELRNKAEFLAHKSDAKRQRMAGLSI
jgi:hypothetical protein